MRLARQWYTPAGFQKDFGIPERNINAEILNPVGMKRRQPCMLTISAKLMLGICNRTNKNPVGMVCPNYIYGSCLRHFIINAQFSVGCASTSSATTTHGYRLNMPTALKKLVEKGYYLSKKIVSLATLLPRKFTSPKSKIGWYGLP